MTADRAEMEPDHEWARKCAEAWVPGDGEMHIGPAEQNLARAYLALNRRAVAPLPEGTVARRWPTDIIAELDFPEDGLDLIAEHNVLVRYILGAGAAELHLKTKEN